MCSRGPPLVVRRLMYALTPCRLCCWTLQANNKSVDINVFSLSLLMSSHQILNLQGSISAMDLEMLQMFSEFANHAVSRLQRKRSDLSRGEEDGDDQARSIFQSIQFLVRDFQFFTDEEDTQQCFEDAREHFKKLFKFGKDHNDTTHERLEELYESLTAAMLPHPGLPLLQRSCTAIRATQ